MRQTEPNHFKRAMAMFAAIAAAMSSPNSQVELAKIGTYVSRGHGQDARESASEEAR